MSGRDRERDIDDLLRDGGGEIGDLYRRLPHYEPPKRLDRAILGEAARAVQSGQPPRRQRWIFGVGSAAGIVLAAGIAWRIGHDAMNQNGSAPATSAPRVVPVEPITEAARAKHEAAPPAQNEASPTASSNAAPASVGQAASDKAVREEAKPALRKARAQSAGAIAPATPKPTPPAPADASPPVAFPNAAKQDVEMERARSDDEKDAMSAGRAQAIGAQPSTSAAKTTRLMSSPTPPSSSVELQRDTQLAPQDWLAHIRQLNRQGRTQQAMESLRLFRHAHPDWTIPDDLRDLSD